MAIHPTAAVDPAAVIGQNVEIGPYAVVEKNCVIGDNCWIDAHAKVCEYTTVGAGSRIYYGALVGTEPQDHRFKPGIVSYTLIGKMLLSANTLPSTGRRLKAKPRLSAMVLC